MGELAGGVLYGLLLEEGDILIFGTYSYSQDFWLRIDLVPICIGVAWSVIMYGAMELSRTLRLPDRVAPMADAVWAILLDLSFDAIAIRLGMWRWNIQLNQGWFGVPAGNFYAWLFVAWGFSWCTRWVRSRSNQDARWGWAQALAPFAAYALVLLALVPFTLIRKVVFTEPGGGWPLFWAVLGWFLWRTIQALRTAPARRRAPAVVLISRAAFHGYFLWALLAAGLYRTVPALIAISAGLFTLEAITLHWRPRLQPRRSPADAPPPPPPLQSPAPW